ncbi:MAG: restriction endonuclease subunit S [Alteromonas sp.]|jgi:type I restriction enzyme S subunit|uniref:restriction endonuclease subunit S n=1 Tax=Alteromonas sp. TaxID=232 RepID=UPI0032D90564
MSNKHAVKEAPASYQSTPVILGSLDAQSRHSREGGNPLAITENINLWISATKAKSTSGRGSNKKTELVGIKKLRELILELAVRGKLVPQNPEDEPASELLKKIDAEKAKLLAEGRIKKQKKLSEISEDEKPFELPDGWEWVRLGGLFNSIISGGTPSKRNADFWNGDIPWASVKDLGKSKYIHATQDYITTQGLEAGSKLVDKGDILICTRMGLGKIGVAQVPIAINQDLKGVKLSSQIELEFFLNTYSRIKIEGTGTTVAGITQDQLLGYVVALPPLAEQHRIVTKVDELMVLCDQLEQHSEHQLDAHKQLVETLLATLIESENADELATNWQRLAEHFDTLFSGALTSTTGIGNGGGEWAIDRLKDTILQLAVMGKLVPQNPDDEPASELLKKIETEKSKLVKEGKIKKQKPLSEITDEEKPFELPDGWEWVTADGVTLIQSGYAYKSPKFIQNGKNQVIRLGNVRPGLIRSNENPVYIDEDYASETSDFKLNSGDIVITMTGTKGKKDFLYSALIGNKHIDVFNLYLNQRLCRLRNILMNERYIVIALRSEQILNKVFSKSTGTANQANISLGAIREWPLPLPPLAEQHRIAAKVDELFALCDQLKARLQAASETQLTLTEALVEQALS